MGRSTSKIWLLQVGVLLTLMLSGASLRGLPLGNPMEPSLYREGWGEFLCFDGPFSFRLGFSADHVFNRKMEVERSSNPDIDQTVIDTNALFLALNWCDRVDLFATLGASKISISTFSSTFQTSVNLPQDANIDFEVESETGFSWGIGLRATLLQSCGFVVGVEGAYFQTDPNLDFIKQENYDIVYASGTDVKYYEWQVGWGVAYPLSCPSANFAWVPYVGFKVGQADLSFNRAKFTIPIGLSTFELFRSESKLVVGFPIGVSFVLCETIGVTVEGRFGDEQALHVNGQFRF